MSSMPRCLYCELPANEILGMADYAKLEGITVQELAREDGTYQPKHDVFCCTPCYVALGMPTRGDGWKAGDEIRSQDLRGRPTRIDWK